MTLKEPVKLQTAVELNETEQQAASEEQHEGDEATYRERIFQPIETKQGVFDAMNDVDLARSTTGTAFAMQGTAFRNSTSVKRSVELDCQSSTQRNKNA